MDPSDETDSETLVEEKVPKWNFSMICERKTTGWQSPEFPLEFIVEGNTEAEAYAVGQKVMSLGYFDLKYRDVKLVKLEKGD